MDNGARIKINRDTGEIEISGSEAFVKEQVPLLERVLNLSTVAVAAPVVETTPAPAAPVEEKRVERRGRPRKIAPVEGTYKSVKPPKIANSFSSYMKSFKRKMKKGDWILAAGYYFQTSTGSDVFSTFNTSKLLKAQGIELANPSQYMKNNISSGRVKSAGKRAYTVTEQGINHLNILMTPK